MPNDLIFLSLSLSFCLCLCLCLCAHATHMARTLMEKQVNPEWAWWPTGLPIFPAKIQYKHREHTRTRITIYICIFYSKQNQKSTKKKTQIYTLSSYTPFSIHPSDIHFVFYFKACAPRYVFHTLQPRKVVRVEPVGTCYLASKNFTEFTEYSPCRTSKYSILVYPFHPF